MAYMGAVGGSVAASTAAAAQHQLEIEEEEEMTRYTEDELAEDWEFKIVRGTFEPFRKPENLRKLIETEARAGWVLVEKFDNNRVRFKRPARARAQDVGLPADVDPYRTVYGAGPTAAAVAIVGVLLGLGLLGVLAILLLS